MTNRLTPTQLRDLADLAEKMPMNVQGYTFLREEAARREAEQKPVPPCQSPDELAVRMQYRREGPGSAAAPKSQEDEWAETFERVADEHFAALNPKRIVPNHDGIGCKRGQSFDLPPEDKPTPAADDLPTTLRHYAASTGTPFLQRGCRDAADRIEAQAREIAQWQDAAGKAAVRAEGLEDLYEREKARADRLAALLRCSLVTVPLNYVLRDEINNALKTEGGDRG